MRVANAREHRANIALNTCCWQQRGAYLVRLSSVARLRSYHSPVRVNRDGALRVLADVDQPAPPPPLRGEPGRRRRDGCALLGAPTARFREAAARLPPPNQKAEEQGSGPRAFATCFRQFMST